MPVLALKVMSVVVVVATVVVVVGVNVVNALKQMVKPSAQLL
jgi:hypothetical protein